MFTWGRVNGPTRGPSGAQDGDLAASGAGGLVESGAFGDGCGVGSAVEDDECAGVEAQPVQVAVELGQSFGEWVGIAFAPDLQLDGFALPGAVASGVGVGPADEEVDAAAADAVVAVDVPAAVDDALEEGHEDQVWGGFVVDGAAGEDVGVFAPECGEFVQEPVEVEPAVGQDEGVGVGQDAVFDIGGQDPDDDFAVDGVGDADRAGGCDQSEVTGVLG